MHSVVAKSSRTNTAQLGRALHAHAHTYAQSQFSQSLRDRHFGCAGIRLIKTTVWQCVCVLYTYVKCAPLSVPFNLTGGAGLFNRYFISAATMPHHQGNSLTLLIEAKLCFHSWRSSPAPPPPIPDPKAHLQRWQNTPLPDFPLVVNSSWSPCDQHIHTRTWTHSHTRLHQFIFPHIKTLSL